MNALVRSEGLLQLGMRGERVRRAQAILAQCSEGLAAAARRALPFLVRRGTPISASETRAMTMTEVLAELPKPHSLTTFTVTPLSSVGALILDARCVSLGLDGALGGDGKDLPVLQGDKLTGAQKALVGRLARDVLRALSEVLSDKAGIGMRAHDDHEEPPEVPGVVLATVFSLQLEDGEPARIALVLPKEALFHHAPEEKKVAPLAIVANAVQNVEVELVATLARARVSLAQVAALRSGKILPLPVHTSTPVEVRVGDRVILRGQPTATAGQLGIIIERHEP